MQKIETFFITKNKATVFELINNTTYSLTYFYERMPYITRSAKKRFNTSEVSTERKNEYIEYMLRGNNFKTELKSLLASAVDGKSKNYKLQKIRKTYQVVNRDIQYLINHPLNINNNNSFVRIAAMAYTKSADILKDIGCGMCSNCDQVLVNKCVAEINIFRNNITRCLEWFPNHQRHAEIIVAQREIVRHRYREEMIKFAEARVAAQQALRRSPRKNISRISYAGME